MELCKISRILASIDGSAITQVISASALSLAQLPTHPTILPNLKVLELYLSSQEYANVFIRRQFVAPSLQTLILSLERNWDSTSLKSRQFIEGSRCLIRYQRMAGWNSASKQFSLCPGLGELSFQFLCPSQDEDALFARMIEARLTMGSEEYSEEEARPAFKTLQLFDYDCSSSLPLPVAELKLLWTLCDRYGLDIIFVDLHYDKIKFEDALDWDALLDRDESRSPGR